MRIPSPRITLHEVGPRDGLQSEKLVLTVPQRLAFIAQLRAAGLRSIEVGSMVSARKVPAMAGTAELLAQLAYPPDTDYAVLVPNQQGVETLPAQFTGTAAFFTAVSDTFTQANIGCTVADSLQRLQQIQPLLTHRALPLKVYVSCIHRCPYQGRTSVQAVVALIEQLLALGVEQIVLGDTTGTMTAGELTPLLQAVQTLLPLERLALHLHDTYGQGLSCVAVALEQGIRRFDTAAGGLGGCPYAPGASGNLATEDVVYFCQGCGIDCGVDLEALVTASQSIYQQLGKPPSSKVTQAMLAQRSL